MKLSRLMAYAIVIVAVFAGLRFANAALVGSGNGVLIHVSVPEGASAAHVAQILQDAGVIGSAFGYRVYAWADRTAQHPKAGGYDLTAGASYHSLARELALGPARRENQLRIVEGWTVDDEIDYLRGCARCKPSPDTVARVTGRSADRQAFDPSLRADFAFLQDLPRQRSLEGYLFPETYRVWADQMPEGLIRKQLGEFQKRFGDAVVTAKSAPLKTLDEVITLASIVEKEVRDPADRKLVAGIFLQRLQIGQALQSDATLSYALGSSHSRASSQDLQSDSPYNTYKHPGLPPSPICNPSESSIRAVLDPTPSPYNYFLTDRTGHVLYARSLEEHIANRRKAGY